MPLRVCTNCNKEDNLVGEIRSPICRTCSMKLFPHRQGTGGGWRSHGTGYIVRTDLGLGKLTYQHRYVMEQAIGRPLESHEVVHHIDGDKHNNLLCNLELTTTSSHSSMHLKERNESFGQHIKAANIRWKRKVG